MKSTIPSTLPTMAAAAAAGSDDNIVDPSSYNSSFVTIRANENEVICSHPNVLNTNFLDVEAKKE